MLYNMFICVAALMLVHFRVLIVNGERFTGLNFHGFQELFHEFKLFFLIVLNNEHLWPRECEVFL